MVNRELPREYSMIEGTAKNEDHPQQLLRRIRRIEKAIDAIAREEQQKLNMHCSDDKLFITTKAWITDWTADSPIESED